MAQTDNETKMTTAYEMFRDAYRVLPSAEEDLAKSRSSIQIMVVEHQRQPIMLAPMLKLTVDGQSKTATIEGDEGRVEMPLSELWSLLQSQVVLKRVQAGSETAVKSSKESYETSARLYGDELVSGITKSLLDKGGEWDLPSVCGEDTIVLGDPAITVRPKTLYADSQNRLHVVCEDECGEEYTELVKYPNISIEDIKKLSALLERPLDEAWGGE